MVPNAHINPLLHDLFYNLLAMYAGVPQMRRYALIG